MDQNRIDQIRILPIAPQLQIIDGQSVPASDGATMDVISPIDGQKFTTIPKGTSEDMNRAIAAARTSFDDRRWAGQPPAARKKVLYKWAELIEAEQLELAVLGVRDNGTNISMAMNAEVGSTIGTIRYYAEAIDKITGEIGPSPENVLSLLEHEPVGVVGAIIPWNFPMSIGAWKLAPALAVGNSVVIKPPETAALSTIRMVELAHEAGLPPGVLNVVTGEGAVVGETLAMSMDVDVLVFTGSGATGRRLLEYSARSNMKRVYLELGGKSPNIVFADAPNMDQAIAVASMASFRNAGQVCISGSRLLVEASIHDEFVEAVAKRAATIKVGDPLDITSEIGSVHSLVQLEQNLGFVRGAREAGSKILSGGERIYENTGGFYMAPAVITNVAEDSTLAQEEVFGPVLATMPFEDEADALRLANSTVYGLSGAIWTSDLGRTHRMIRGIRSGMLAVNTYGVPDISVPLGGHRQSGNGSDKSLHALHKYTNIKAAWIQL